MVDLVQLNQQYVEVVDSGNPATLVVKLNQQYIEVVTPYISGHVGFIDGIANVSGVSLGTVFHGIADGQANVDGRSLVIAVSIGYVDGVASVQGVTAAANNGAALMQ